MSFGVGVDVGTSVVKVATDDAASTRQYRSPRVVDLTELLARIGTRVPHVRQVGDDVVARSAEHLFVDEVLHALRRTLDTDPSGPAGVSIIAPAWWSPRAFSSARQALDAAGLGSATLVSGAVASVQAFRAAEGEQIPDTVAVLDVGAHTCSAAVVTGCHTGEAQVIGQPTVVHGRGGRDLDARLLHLVLDGLRGHGVTLERDDPEAVETARALLDECRIAKEALSIRPVVTVEPRVPGAASQFRLVRADHDDVARPAAQEIVQMLRECLAIAEHDVGAVLLAGGGAAIPLVTQQISVGLGLPVLLDADPATLAVRGGARQAVASSTPRKPGRRGSLRSRSRPEEPSREGRHRGVRAGVAATYVAIALVAGIGGPDPSVASPSGSPGSAAVSGDQELVGDVQP